MRRIPPVLGVGFSILLSLAGLMGFGWLLIREMGIFWIIVAPVIFAVYQIPAVVVYFFWKKAYGKKPISKDGDPEGRGGAGRSEPPV